MQTNNITTAQKFRDAESLWFWFISSSQIRDHMYRGGTGNFRPCELVDVETLVTRLFLSGKLSREQLSVIQEYGLRRRAPHQHIYSENRAAGLWSAAMVTLSVAARTKGWVE
ncbi:MAG: hypothetical protein FWF34_01155 [Alphaproteobacteria bacterium]|nr:hypothetical protein [Alphaproteobacteria bacterium]MCL2889849.1 hypothetical protein [Alphaproteobacteria bacterium]